MIERTFKNIKLCEEDDMLQMVITRVGQYANCQRVGQYCRATNIEIIFYVIFLREHSKLQVYFEILMKIILIFYLKKFINKSDIEISQ